MAYLYVMMARKAKVCNTPLMLKDLSDEDVFQFTRFPRSAVLELCAMLASDLQHPTARSHAIPVETQVLAALQFYASGSFQWVVGRSCGLSQASVSVAVNDVTRALVKLAPSFVQFPTEQAEVRANKQAFHAVAGFPNVIGAIDCTHVAIKAPSQNEEAYVNRKGVHTINVQAVCDPNMRLLNVVAKWPGSSHDSYVWKSSSLHDLFVQGHMPDGWLIGVVLSYLQYTALQNNQCPTREKTV